MSKYAFGNRIKISYICMSKFDHFAPDASYEMKGKISESRLLPALLLRRGKCGVHSLLVEIYGSYEGILHG